MMTAARLPFYSRHTSSADNTVVDVRAEMIVNDHYLWTALQQELKDSHAVTSSSVREVTENFMSSHFEGPSQEARVRCYRKLIQHLPPSARQYYGRKRKTSPPQMTFNDIVLSDANRHEKNNIKEKDLETCSSTTAPSLK